MNTIYKKFNFRPLLKVFLLGLIVELLFYAGIILNNSAINYIGLFVFIGSFFLLKPEQHIYFIFLLIPNQRLLVLGDSTVSILNLGFLYLLLSHLLKNKIRYFPPKISILILILILYGAIISIINNSLNELVLLIKFLLVSVVLFVEFHKADLQKIKNSIICFLGGIFFITIISLIFGSIGGTDRFQGGELNEPNYIGTVCSFGLAILLVISQKINFNKLIIIFFLAFVILVGLLTQSRSFVLSFSIISGVYFILNFRKRFLLTVVLGSFTLIFLLNYLIRFYQNNAILQAINSRIINPRGDDVSGGRLDLWNSYFNLVISNDKSLFFGIGSDAMQKFNLEQVAHNAFLEDFVTFGIIGVILTYAFLYFIYKEVKYKNASLISGLPLIIFLLNSMTLHSFLGMGGLVQLFVGLLVINCYNLKHL